MRFWKSWPGPSPPAQATPNRKEQLVFDLTETGILAPGEQGGVAFTFEQGDIGDDEGVVFDLTLNVPEGAGIPAQSPELGEPSELPAIVEGAPYALNFNNDTEVPMRYSLRAYTEALIDNDTFGAV